MGCCDDKFESTGGDTNKPFLIYIKDKTLEFGSWDPLARTMKTRAGLWSLDERTDASWLVESRKSSRCLFSICGLTASSD